MTWNVWGNNIYMSPSLKVLHLIQVISIALCHLVALQVAGSLIELELIY